MFILGTMLKDFESLGHDIEMCFSQCFVGIESDKHSGRPALRSSNETVNQFKIDVTKASEIISCGNLNLSASSLDLDRSSPLLPFEKLS